MSEPLRLTPGHGLLIERGLALVAQERRQNGTPGVPGAEELVELARQLRTDGARLIVDPHEWAPVGTGGQQVTGAAEVGTVAGVTRLLSRPEAARALGISVDTLDRRVADGTIPARRIGRRVLFDPTAITTQEPAA